MHDMLEEVGTNNDVKIHDSIHILDPILINLDEEDNLNDVDDEYETIDIGINLPNMFSSQLTLTTSIDHCGSQEDPCLELAIIPTMLDIFPLESYPPFLNYIQ